MRFTPKEKFRFVITNEDPNASEVQVLDLLETATSEAVEAARAKFNTEATTRLEGGFGGLGEAAVILAICHSAKLGAVAFATGMAGAAGKNFYDEYLAPRLRKLNLLPSKFEVVSKKAIPAKRKKKRSDRGLA